MSHKMLRPFIVKVSILGYFPLHYSKIYILLVGIPTYIYYLLFIIRAFESKPPKRLLNITYAQIRTNISVTNEFEGNRKMLTSLGLCNM